MIDIVDRNEIIGVCQREAPVDVEKIAAKFGIVAAYSLLDDAVSGYIEHSEVDGYEIIINLKHSLEQQRFTLAHIIGHWCFHKEEIGNNGRLEEHFEDNRLYRDILYRSDDSTPNGRKLADRYEVEANAFAANLLMPEKLIYKLCYTGKIADVAVMANKLGVSHQSLEFWLDSLRIDLEDLAAVKLAL